MRIAVNTRLLLANKLEGIGWFTFETLKRITRNHPEHQFIFIFDRAYDQQFVFSENITPVVAPPPTRHPLLWWFWFEFVIPRVLKKYKADLFLSTDGYISLRSKVPALDVIHDINFAHRPQDLPWKFRTYYNHFFPKFAKHTTRIATVSDYSKQDLVKTYSIPGSKIDVVYNGSHEMYQPLSEEQKHNTRERFTNGTDYFVFVGALHPRKNIARLLQAFDLFRTKTASAIKLVIVGGKLFKSGDIYETYRHLHFKEDVIFTGRLEPEDLKSVMGSAIALTFVPLFEGFGIPVVEAFNSNTPVIASNVTSLPEVAGEAALLVDPKSIDEISGAMLKITTDSEYRSELIKRGKIQREKFSWDKTAAKLWSSMEKTMAGK
jgi:glycosyltransferase involved in cell wall biosynthesis